jgi:hypothetical protein
MKSIQMPHPKTADTFDKLWYEMCLQQPGLAFSEDNLRLTKEHLRAIWSHGETVGFLKDRTKYKLG